MPFGSFFKLVGGHLEVSYASSPSEGLRVKVQLEQPELTRVCARRRTLHFQPAGFSSLPTEMLELIVHFCFSSWCKATRVMRVNKALCKIGRGVCDKLEACWWSGDGSPLTPFLSRPDQEEEFRRKMSLLNGHNFAQFVSGFTPKDLREQFLDGVWLNNFTINMVLRIAAGPEAFLDMKAPQLTTLYNLLQPNYVCDERRRHGSSLPLPWCW